MSTAFLARWNEEAIDENYEQWRRDPASVGPDWASFFEGFELGFARYSKSGKASTSPATSASPQNISLELRVERLINAYRTLGHTKAKLNPLSEADPQQPLLALAAFDLNDSHLDTVVSSASFQGGEAMPLRVLIEKLESIYCGTSTAEFMHIQDPATRDWVRDRVEQPDSERERTSHYRILRTLHKAELFENFLHTTYVGSKRFSIEGGESLMVALSEILRRSPGEGIKEIVLGMAHRGRLNVLANFMKKPFAVIFNEFSDEYIPDIGSASGDVKYHLGYQTSRTSELGGDVEIYLTANPSHLEAVDPVAMGKARARQRILKDTETRKTVMPLLVHGDAALIGQGMVAECLNLSQLAGYCVGGTVHLVVNNQIGFTTLPADARSTVHCTDIAKFIEAPIFHVNGDDPVAVCEATRNALEFRQRFGRDVFVDIVCYRRYGHNEGDEPSFTQPNLYSRIKTHPKVSDVFLQNVLPQGTITEEQITESRERTSNHLAEAFAKMKKGLEASGYNKKAAFAGSTAIFQPPFSFEPVRTAISQKMLKTVAEGLTTIPEGFRILPKIKKTVIERRRKAFDDGGPYDWGFAEALAFGSLLLEGVPVRLSGEDSRRATFSHRHAVFYDEITRERYIPLLHLAADQEEFCVYNSPLSEVSVLGFDYGYSLDFPEMLCLWEAQYGDFANGAQVIIDQFISSAETKWLRPSSLVMLLPHGYEGQGPEHSSARLERFLQLCAEENMQVCNLTTPAQYFHALRRQMKRPFRKPLVIMTPKSLVRAEVATSVSDDFTKGEFHEIYPGPAPANPKKVDRIILCSGKVYYDLLAYQQKEGEADSSVLIRMEQLYPLHEEKLKAVVDMYPQTATLVWCQEEPENMGAYSFMLPRLQKLFGRDIFYAGRKASASPAVGAASLHRKHQAVLVQQAFLGAL